jgi:hypothetical protein
LLSAIENCKENKIQYLEYLFIAFTSNKNNTFNGLKETASNLISRSLLLLEEHRVIFEYLTGKKNVAADTLFYLIMR